MLYQLELAGAVSEELYAKSIPKECSMQTFSQHMNMMLCWGLMRSIEQGHRQDCSGCDENQENYDARVIHLAERKAAKCA